MSYNHQPQLSINSIQSLVEPVTPPLGQMNNKQNHQRTNSLDLSGFNQFMASNSPMNLGTLSPISGGLSSISSGGAMKPRIASLPLINEFDASSMASGVTLIPGNDQASVGSSSALSSLRTVSASTVGSVSNQGTSASSSVPAGAAALVVRSSSSVSSSASLSNGNCGGSGTGGGPGTGCSSTADLSSLSIQELDYLQLATDQYGCRFLQRKLENPEESTQVRDLMYEHIKPYLLDLILDPFGNYLIQKLCEYLTNDQKTMMIQDIYSHVFQISINQYGTRSLQKIIDTVETEQHIDMIVNGFSQEYTSISQVLTLINDLNGNHVIQKCIFKFEPTKFDFIIDAIVEKDNIIKISTHKHGCCVLQKLLSVCTLQQIFKISVKIIQYLPGLINDQFGNYIIQFLFDIKELDFYLLGEIFGKLSHELCQLSCLKFSSNVVEKFIKKLFLIVHDSLGSASAPSSVSSNSSSVVLSGNSQLCQQQADDVVNVAMGILLTITDIFTANLNVLIRDNFGNYALQTLLDVKNYSQLLEIPGNNYIHSSQKLAKFSHEFTLKVGNLIVLTKELLPSIKTTTYAKKIKLKVKAYAELTGVAFTDLSPKKGQQSSGNNSNSANSHRKQHARRFSLPANSFRHQKSGNNMPMNNGYSVSQAPHPSQQYQHVGMMAMPQKLNFGVNQLPQTQQQPQPQQLSHRPIFAQSQHMPLPSQTTPSHKVVTNRLHYQPQHQQMQPQPHDYLSANFTNTHSAYSSNLQAAASSDHFAYEQSKQNWHQHHQQQPQQLHHRINQPQQPHQSQHHMSQSHANLNDTGFLLHSSTSAAPSMLAMNNSTPVTTSSQQPLYMTNNTQIEYHMNMGSGFYH